MGVFGGFVYGSGVGHDVYGPDADVLAAELISANLVRIVTDLPIVVDAAYKDPTNYTITVTKGIGDIAVRSVMPIQTNTATEILLITDKVTKGTTYAVSIGAAVRSTKGQGVVGTAQFTGRRTKTENMVRGLPSHFNKYPTALIFSVLAALGISDDLIGGSLDEDS